MKAEIRQRWLDELRSGNRKQTRTTLRFEDSFCCLGVLCDLYDSSRWRSFEYRGDEGDGDWRSGMPPNDVLEAVGLQVTQADGLAAANDGGKTFAEIADIIEREIPAE